MIKATTGQYNLYLFKYIVSWPLFWSLAFLLSQKLKPRATQSHIMVIEATTEDTEDTTEAGGDERDGLLTPSLKQLKPQFPDPHQTLKLSHIMVMDMDMAIHITDITGEERSDPLKPNQHQTLKLNHIMVMDMATHITDIMDIILENDPLMPNLHPKLKANHGMDTMATPAITVTDITTGVKTHNGLISAQEQG